MKRITAAILILALTRFVSGCGKAAPKPLQLSQGSQAATTDTTAAASDKARTGFDLMASSSLDTCQGTFAGDWEEAALDNITVRAAVLVKLENCRVTEITFTDSQHIHPAAARLIPQRIIETQRLPVEAVSGASVASWTIMTAVAVALGIDLVELEEKE